MNYDAASCLAQALRRVLRIYDWPSELSWHVLSYGDQFQNLWKIDDPYLASLKNKRQRLIVVVDDAPTDQRFPSIPVGQYVAPLDWAVAVSLKFIKQQRTALPAPSTPVEVPWRILLVDACGREAQGGNAQRLFAQLARSGSSPLPWISMTTATDLCRHLPALLDSAPLTVQGSVDALVRGLWAAELTQSDIHSIRHSISNLIGPRTLTKAMRPSAGEDGRADGTLAALDTLLDALDLAPDTDDAEPGPWISRGQWEPAGIKRWVLIDDMEDLGWSDFLHVALDLRAQELSSFGHREIPDIFKQHILGLEDAVLFLDLRLFARGTWGDETRFLRTLAQYASRYIEGQDGLVWPGFTSQEIEAVRRCSERAKRIEDAEYHTALAFFPRLLCHLDPTLPIILFSSTGRKEIADQLRPYGNIVLEFTKPRLSGESPSAMVHETRLRFVTAVRRALDFSRARRAYRSTLGASGMSIIPVAEPAPAQLTGAKNPIVEIYIDESATKTRSRFAVGGVAIYFPDEAAVETFDRTLASRGLIWGLAEGHAPLDPSDPLPTDYLPKEHANVSGYETDLEKILSAAKTASTEIRFAAVGLVETAFRFHPQQQLPSILREDSIDNLYRTMLQEIITCILFDWMPRFSSSVGDVRIDVATRLGHEPSLTVLQDLHYLYGIDLQSKSSNLYFSLSTQEVYPIVARSLVQNPTAAGRTRVTRARGTTLFDFKEKIIEFRRNVKPEDYEKRIRRTFRPRQIHFLADWLSRFAAQPRFIGRLGDDLFRAGFLQERNHQFRHWSAAASRAREGRIAESLFETYQALSGRPDNSPYPLRRWQVADVSSALKQFRGSDFVDLVRLSAESPLNSVAAVSQRS